MSTSLGLIESKGIVALIEAADFILKNSPAKILGVNKLDNGLIAMGITGDYDYVNTAIESAVDAARRVGEIHSFTVIEKPSNEVMKIFGDLFSAFGESGFTLDDLGSDNIIDLPSVKVSSFEPSSRRERNRKTAIRKEKSRNTVIEESIDDSVMKEELSQSASNLSEEKMIDLLQETESEKSLSTIERLRREALGSSTAKTPKVEKQKTSPAKLKEKIDITLSTENAKVDFELISKMNVHKLRHYAREFPDFPIKGREISRANRDELMQLFKKLD
jgi:hypothetical protein